MTLPPGPWTADIIRMIVKERVAEIKTNLERRISNVQTAKTMAVVEKRTPQA